MFSPEISHKQIITEALSQYYFNDNNHSLEQITEQHKKQQKKHLDLSKLLDALIENSAPKQLMLLLSLQVFAMEAAVKNNIATTEEHQFVDSMNKYVFARLNPPDEKQQKISPSNLAR